MDEVLYAWERTARYLLRNVYGWPDYGEPPEGLDLEQPFQEWEFGNTVGKPAYEWLFDPEGGIRWGLFRHGHVITDAMVGVRGLKAAGHELVIVTHRPEAGVQDTLAWIDFHFGREDPYPWSGVSILSDRQPKTTIPFDIIIDDSIDNCFAATRAGRRSVLFGAAWNGGDITWRDIPGIIRFEEAIHGRV